MGAIIEPDNTDELPEIPAALSRPARIAPRPTANPYDDLILDSATRHRVDPDFVRSVMQQESTNKPGATSNKGASGLMQLMPATARRFGVTKIYDPQQNIEAGTKYLRWLLDKFDGDQAKALAGYNAGEGAVDKYNGVPPYKETQGYVTKIGNNYNKTLPDIPHDDLPDIPDEIGMALGTPSPVQGSQPFLSQQQPVPEKPETLEEQRKASHDPKSTRAGVYYPVGTAMPSASKDELDLALGDGSILRVDKAKFVDYSTKSGVTADDIQSGRSDFTPLIGGKAQSTTDTSSKLGVTTKDANGTELVSSSVEDTSAIAQEAALQQAQFPGKKTTTEATTSDAIIAARTRGAPAATNATVGQRPGTKQPATPVLEQPTGMTYEGSEPVIGDEELQSERPVRSVKESEADNAVAETITAKTPREGLQQLAAKYGIDVEKVLKENSDLSLIKASENGQIDVTYGDLKAMGVDTAALTREKVVENRVENPTPDLRPVPITDDFGKSLGEDINRDVGALDKAVGGDGTDTAAAGLVGELAALPGDLSGIAGGIIQAANEYSPTMGSIDEILSNGGARKIELRDPTVENLKAFYEGSRSIAEQTGAFDEKGKPTIPTQMFRMVGAIPKIAIISMFPGGMIGGFALEGASVAKLKGGSNADVLKAAVKGGIQGSVFQFLPKAVQSQLAEGTGNLITAGIEIPAIGTANYTVGKIFGDPDEDNLINSAAIALFHGYGLLKEGATGKVAHAVDDKGNEVFLKVGSEGQLETVARQKADIEMVLPKGAQKYFNRDAAIQGQVKRTEARANVAVPETAPEPEAQQYTSQLDEIRQRGAKTKTEIQQLFPDANLSREEAQELRRQAWDEPAGTFDITNKDGARFKVKEDRGKQLLVEDEKGSITLQPERKFTDLDAFRSAKVNLETAKDTLPAESKLETVTHPNEKIDGQEIVAKTEDGRVVVANPENKSGISVVKNRAEEATALLSNKETPQTQASVPKADLQSDEKTATEAAHDAATSPQNDLSEPSQAMKEAGNYQKGHINIGGLDISVENPVGSERSGVDRDGKKWSIKMAHHYGYIKRTVGADTEQIDVFVKDSTPGDFARPVYVVDQIHPDTGKFDEHKVLLGFDSEKEARDAYAANYAKDWKGLKSITEMPLDEFKDWVRDGTKKHSVSEEKNNERDESASAGGSAAPEGSGRDGQKAGEASAEKEEKGNGPGDGRKAAAGDRPVEKPKVKTEPSQMQKFLADDKAHELTREILDGTLAGDEADIAVAKLSEIGKNYGLSEKDVQGVIERGRANKQRSENKRKAADIVRESRQPAGTAVEGSKTKILTPESSKEYEARYVIREASDVFPSHNPTTFQPEPDYYYTNDRHYDREEQYQKQVIDRSKAFRPEYFVTDTPTAADGPPVIDAEGNVLGGNSRAMILRRIYDDESPAARKAYQIELHRKAKHFGIDASELLNFDRPVLVREISDESINKQHAITELNETSTTDLTIQEQAVADAGKLSDDAVEYITNKIFVSGAEASLIDALNAHGVKIVNKLIDDGVFGEGERNKLLDDGAITADGKKRIERLLLGKVFTDLGQIENATPSVNNTVVRIVAPLMKVNEDPGWNILLEVQEGIELLNEAKAAGQGKNIDGFAANLNFLRPEGWSDQAVAMANTLNLGQLKAADIFKAYAEDMRLSKYGGNAMFDLGGKTQAEAYKDAFGVEPKEAIADFATSSEGTKEATQTAEPQITKDSEQATDTPPKGQTGSESTAQTKAAAPENTRAPAAPDIRAGDRVQDTFGRKGTVFADKDGGLHVEQDGTKARLPLSDKWSLKGKRPLEFNGFKKGDVVQKKQQLGKVYERGGQLRVKWTKEGKTKSEPLSEKWSKGTNPEAGSVDPTLLTLGLNKTIAEDVAPGIKRIGKGLFDAVDDVRGLIFAGGRGEAARLGATSLRAETGKMARSALIAETALKDARKYFSKNPVEDNYDFIAHIESDDVRSLPPDEQGAAEALRKLLDESRKRVQDLGTGKLDAYIENYFPHIWKDPTTAANVFAKVLAKRPFEGSKSFLKKRTLNTFQAGLDAGLEPVSDNPVDLALLKIKDMDRYVAAHKTVNYLKEQGLAKFVSMEDRAPDGWIKLDDKIGDVYAPPVTVQREYVDKAVFEGLSKLADGLGIKHERVANAGSGRIGYSEQGNDRIVTQYATGERVLAHEISHQLDHKYGMIERFINNDDPKLRRLLKPELRVLADSKQASFDQPEGFKTNYTRKKVEQMAHILESYVNNKELLGRIAPTVKAEFEKMIDENPELGIIKQIERSLGKTELQTEVKRGFVKIGHVYAAEPAANIINNYLSPGLTGSKFATVRDGFKAWRYVGNLQNQAQLGLSCFHAMFTTLDAVTSKAALGINQAASGQPLRGLASLAELPISPITNLIRGDKVYREGLTPGSTDPFSQAMADWVAEAGGRFKMDDFYHTKAAQAMTDAFRRGNILGGIVRIPSGVLDIASRPLMEWLVPRQKLGVFADLMKHELGRLEPDATKEQLREAADRVWDTVDNRMGQLVYDNLFWNKTIKDLSMASVRSVGWNLGDIRELGGAVKDVVTLPMRVKRLYEEGKAVEPIVTYRMAYAAALPFVAGTIGATTMYLMTGRTPQELKDYFFPQTGNIDENGNPERLSLPTYMKDVYAYSRHPGKTLSHKMHPLIGLITEMLANKDYYGTEIRNADDPLIQQIGDVATHVGKGFVPLSVTGAMKEKDRQGSPALKVLPFFGFTPAPKDINSTKAEDLLSEIQAGHRDQGSRTKTAAAKSQEMSDLVRMKKKGHETDFQTEFEKAKAAGIVDDDDMKTIQKRVKSTYLESGVTRLTIGDGIKVYKLATDEERERIRDEMEKKIKNASQDFGKITDKMREDLESLGFTVPEFRGTPEHPVRKTKQSAPMPTPTAVPTIGPRQRVLPESKPLPGATIAPRP